MVREVEFDVCINPRVVLVTTDTASTDHPHHSESLVVVRVPGHQGAPTVPLTGVPPSLLVSSTDLTGSDVLGQLSTLFTQEGHTDMSEVAGEAPIVVVSQTPARHHTALSSVDLAGPSRRWETDWLDQRGLVKVNDFG